MIAQCLFSWVLLVTGTGAAGQVTSSGTSHRVLILYADRMVTWNQAVELCRSQGGTLVTIDNEDIYTFLISAATSTLQPYWDDFWTGLHYVSGEFRWQSSCAPLGSYQPWMNLRSPEYKSCVLGDAYLFHDGYIGTKPCYMARGKALCEKVQGSCGFDRYIAHSVLPGPYASTAASASTLAECQSLCLSHKGAGECWGVEWTSYFGNNDCHLHYDDSSTAMSDRLQSTNMFFDATYVKVCFSAVVDDTPLSLSYDSSTHDSEPWGGCTADYRVVAANGSTASSVTASGVSNGETTSSGISSSDTISTGVSRGDTTGNDISRSDTTSDHTLSTDTTSSSKNGGVSSTDTGSSSASRGTALSDTVSTTTGVYGISSTTDKHTINSNAINKGTADSNTVNYGTTDSNSVSSVKTNSNTVNSVTTDSNSVNKETTDSNTVSDGTIDSNTVSSGKTDSNTINDATTESNTVNYGTTDNNSVSSVKTNSNTVNDVATESNSVNKETTDSNTVRDGTIDSNTVSSGKTDSNTINDATTDSNTVNYGTTDNNTVNDGTTSNSTVNDGTTDSNTFRTTISITLQTSTKAYISNHWSGASSAPVLSESCLGKCDTDSVNVQAIIASGIRSTLQTSPSFAEESTPSMTFLTTPSLFSVDTVQFSPSPKATSLSVIMTTSPSKLASHRTSDDEPTLTPSFASSTKSDRSELATLIVTQDTTAPLSTSFSSSSLLPPITPTDGVSLSLISPLSSLHALGPSQSPSFRQVPASPGRNSTACCGCRQVAHLTEDQKKSAMAEIMASLSLNPKEISANQRRRNSALDPRPSATAVGYSGVVVLTVLLAGVVIIDMANIVRDVKYFIFK